MDRQTLEQLAALAKAVPCEWRPSVQWYGGAAVEILVSFGGALHSFVSSRGSVIVSTEIEVDGVAFHAQYDRPATDDEKAKLDEPSATHHEGFVSADLVQS